MSLCQSGDGKLLSSRHKSFQRASMTSNFSAVVISANGNVMLMCSPHRAMVGTSVQGGTTGARSWRRTFGPSNPTRRRQWRAPRPLLKVRQQLAGNVRLSRKLGASHHRRERFITAPLRRFQFRDRVYLKLDSLDGHRPKLPEHRPFDNLLFSMALRAGVQSGAWWKDPASRAFRMVAAAAPSSRE